LHTRRTRSIWREPVWATLLCLSWKDDQQTNANKEGNNLDFHTVEHLWVHTGALKLRMQHPQMESAPKDEGADSLPHRFSNNNLTLLHALRITAFGQKHRAASDSFIAIIYRHLRRFGLGRGIGHRYISSALGVITRSNSAALIIECQQHFAFTSAARSTVLHSFFFGFSFSYDA
jgi:hypothetical protein